MYAKGLADTRYTCTLFSWLLATSSRQPAAAAVAHCLISCAWSAKLRFGKGAIACGISCMLLCAMQQRVSGHDLSALRLQAASSQIWSAITRFHPPSLGTHRTRSSRRPSCTTLWPPRPPCSSSCGMCSYSQKQSKLPSNPCCTCCNIITVRSGRVPSVLPADAFALHSLVGCELQSLARGLLGAFEISDSTYPKHYMLLLSAVIISTILIYGASFSCLKSVRDCEEAMLMLLMQSRLRASHEANYSLIAVLEGYGCKLFTTDSFFCCRQHCCLVLHSSKSPVGKLHV